MGWSKQPLLFAVALPATLSIVSTLSAATAGEPLPIPPGTPVTITVTQAAAPSPPASIILGAAHGHVTPTRCGFTHTGGGNIDVAQPTSDVVVVTMTGVAVAGAHPCKDSLAAMSFDLAQSFEISFDNPKLKRAKLVLEGRVIGLLRSYEKGRRTAGEGPGCATILANDMSLATLCVPQHGVSGGENLSLNDHEGPVGVPISPGKYTLVQSFVVSAAHPHSLRPARPPRQNSRGSRT